MDGLALWILRVIFEGGAGGALGAWSDLADCLIGGDWVGRQEAWGRGPGRRAGGEMGGIKGEQGGQGGPGAGLGAWSRETGGGAEMGRGGTREQTKVSIQSLKKPGW